MNAQCVSCDCCCVRKRRCNTSCEAVLVCCVVIAVEAVVNAVAVVFAGWMMGGGQMHGRCKMMSRSYCKC